MLARFLQTPTEASGEAIVRTLAAASSLCHGRSTAGWRFLALEAAAAAADDWFPRKEYRDLTTEAVALRKRARRRVQRSGAAKGITPATPRRCDRRDSEAANAMAAFRTSRKTKAIASRCAAGVEHRPVLGITIDRESPAPTRLC